MVTLECTDAFTPHANQGGVRSIRNVMQSGVEGRPASKEAVAPPSIAVTQGTRDYPRMLHSVGRHRSREPGRKTNLLGA